MSVAFTSGAARALERAGRLARIAEAVDVAPKHLLWALSREESRASELLGQHGLGEEAIRTLFAFVRSETDDPAENESDPPVPMMLSSMLSDVVREARQLAWQSGGDIEAGTEQLLMALLTVDLEVAKTLATYGLSREQLSAILQAESGQLGMPIAADFAIHWTEPTSSDRTDTLRVLDAAANRAREGLRVIEDFVRFSLDDAHLSRLLKELRHELTERLSDLDRLGLVGARDTLGDVGTQIKTKREQTRRSPWDIVVANCRRVEEALRTLEEFSKLVIGGEVTSGHDLGAGQSPHLRLADPRLSGHLEQVRYRLYTIEKALCTTLASRERLSGCDVYFLVTESLCHHGSGPAVRQALSAGVRIVQLREKELSDRRLLESARRIRQWTREADALFIMNDRADLAVLADADGVHVGQDELTVREARRIVGPQRLVGASTHTIEQARQAALDGADYLGVGPCFATGTKSFEQLAGLDFVRQVALEITLPWFAIGGINGSNIAAVRDAGVSRIAVSSAICASTTPGQTATELIESLREVRPV